MNFRWMLAVAVVLPALGAPSAGALVWERQSVSIVVQPEQAGAVAEFSFRNGGSAPVSIVSMEPSCSCVTPSLAKETYAPGETGRLSVAFTTGGGAGTQEKSILVTTDEAGAQPTQLTVSARILTYLAVEPSMVYWKAGGDTAELTVTCSAQTAHAVTLTGVTCSLPDITARIDTLDPGKSYAVRLRSAAHAERTRVLVEINAQVAGVGARVYRAFAYFH
jgi:hypothetical protein